MRILDGRELADFIKERQARQVRALRQAAHVFPKLAIVQTGDNHVSDAYVRMKRQYGEDVLIDTEIHVVTMETIIAEIQKLNADASVHGIIVQLPIADTTRTDEVVAAIVPSKDVDGLGPNADFVSATATAIDWLLAGYNVTLRDRKIAIVGNGRLIGKPLAKLWRTAGHDVEVLDRSTDDLQAALRSARIIIAATGQPGLITEHMIQPSAVVVDAGTASEDGKLLGDVAESVRERNDLTITPVKGGVGPLTIASLFDNVITSARRVADEQAAN
jgi:methylenetetrahydrofolate dehydrogenase (NADP+) / methenyltetrahydrofolate cyclohydrolase